MKQLPVLFSILFLVMLGFGIIIPVLPFYAEGFGASEFTFGWLMASYSMMQFIFAPIWGRLSDRIGRKPILLIGLSGYILTFLIFAFSSQLWMLFLARILSGILSSATLPTAMAIVADQTTEKERGKGMGILGAGIGLGFIFGPAFGGILSKYSILGLSNLATPFLVTSFLAIIPLMIAFVYLKESLHSKNNLPITEKKALKFKDKRNLYPIYIAAFIVSLTLAGLEGTFAFFIKDKADIDSSQLGYIFMFMGVANAIVQGGLIGKLINRFGEKTTIKIGLFVSGLGMFLITLGTDFWTFTLFLIIFGMGNGMMRPSISSYISKNTEQQGTSIGIMDSMDSIGRVIGPPGAGLLYIQLIDLPFILGALLIICFLFIFHLFYRLKTVRKLSVESR